MPYFLVIHGLFSDVLLGLIEPLEELHDLLERRDLAQRLLLALLPLQERFLRDNVLVVQDIEEPVQQTCAHQDRNVIYNV